jgi:hypothetical protein
LGGNWSSFASDLSAEPIVNCSKQLQLRIGGWMPLKIWTRAVTLHALRVGAGMGVLSAVLARKCGC